METPFSWSWSILPVLLCLGVAARGKPVAPPLSAPNPLPPSEVKCISNAAWSTPDFLPKNCYTTLARFHGRMIDEHGLMVPHEFLAPGTRGTTIFPQVKTPRKYYYLTCTLAIVMLDYFDPRELGLPPGAIFSPNDITSYNDLGHALQNVANQCLSKYKPHDGSNGSTTESLGFRSNMGWGSCGLTGSIGAFMWATDSAIDRRVRPGVAPNGVIQHFNLTTDDHVDG